MLPLQVPLPLVMSQLNGNTRLPYTACKGAVVKIKSYSLNVISEKWQSHPSAISVWNWLWIPVKCALHCMSKFRFQNSSLTHLITDQSEQLLSDWFEESTWPVNHRWVKGYPSQWLTNVVRGGADREGTFFGLFTFHILLFSAHSPFKTLKSCPQLL